MVNASLFTVELWMHLRDVLGGLLSSHSLLMSSIKRAHAFAIEFD